MTKLQKTTLNKMIWVAAFLIFLIAIFYQNLGQQQDILSSLEQVLPGTSSYEKASQQGVFKAYGSNKDFLGYGAIASSSGYAGPITVMVGIDPSGKIVNTILLEDFETPLYLQRIITHDYFDNFIGKSVSDTFEFQVDVDSVSGATYSAKGIAGGVRKAAHQVGKNELGLEIAASKQPVVTIKEIFLIVLYALVFLSIWRKLPKLRVLSLLLSVGILGFWQNSLITFANLTTLFTGNAPSFLESIYWYLLVVGVLLGIFLSGRNFYCYYLCPFGAIQEFLGKIGIKIKTCPRQIAQARKVRLPLAWLAFIVALAFHNHSLASFEPFSALFKLQANAGQWLLLPIILFIGIFIYRFWCRFFCPVGAVLDLTVTLRKKGLFIWKKINGKDTCSQ